jgi:hypothetical protein
MEANGTMILLQQTCHFLMYKSTLYPILFLYDFFFTIFLLFLISVKLPLFSRQIKQKVYTENICNLAATVDQSRKIHCFICNLYGIMVKNKTI